MERKEFKRICMILHVCANYIKSCSGDLFIDLTKLLEMYKKGEWPIVTVRRSGSDLLERFEACLIERGEPHGVKESIEYAKSTLGVDFFIEITPYLVKLNNMRLDRMALNQLKARFEDFAEVEVIDISR